jgi:hypothetical protein
MVHESVPTATKHAFRSHPRRVFSISYLLTGFFHGGNTGSNPVGDANKINDLLEFDLFAEGLKRFDKKNSLVGRLLSPCLLAQHENNFYKLCLRCALRRSDGLCVRVGDHFVTDDKRWPRA